MDRYVAIKVLPEPVSHDAGLREQLDRELKAVARLEHPHILPVYDSGWVGQQIYLVTRYIETGTLQDRLAAGPLSLAEANRMLSQIGGALAYAHQSGVLHRDVRPGNIMLDAHGDCYLADVGLAPIVEAALRPGSATVGVGTPAYMSPEQVQGEKVDARSDLYSLGVTLYEMVVGQAPFHAETPLALALKHVTAPPPAPHLVKPDVPPQVEQVILKALAKDPSQRFQTAAEMVAALDEAVRPAALQAAGWAPPASVAVATEPPVVATEPLVAATTGPAAGLASTVATGSALPPPPAAGLAPAAQPEPARELNIWERQGEGVGIRLSAFFVDLFAIVLISSIVLLVAVLVRGANPLHLEEQDVEGWLGIAALIAVPIIWLLYFTLLEGISGMTLGKWIGARPVAVLRVVKKDGTRCGFGRAAVRALFGLLEDNLLGAILVWVTPLHQRIGDLVAGTLVVSLHKPLGITFQGRSAAFEFADRRRVVVDELLRGRVQRWLNWNRMQLTGVTPEGKRVRLRDLAFPDTYKRGQVRDELEQFFKTRIPERVQWWRLLPALVLLLLVLAGIVSAALLSEDGRLSTRLAATPTRRVSVAPTSTRAPVVTIGPTALREPTASPQMVPPPPLPTQPRATATRVASPTPKASPTPTAGPVWSVEVNADNVNLRAGPGKVYGVIKVLQRGTRLTALVRTADAEWFKVLVDDTGQAGWISVTVVDLEFDPDDLPLASVIPPTPQQVATATPPASTPAPSGPAAGAATVHGRILWNGQPFAGVTVKLCSDWHMFGGCKGTEYRAATAADGLYWMEGVSPGKYSFVTQIPGQSNESMWLGMSVEVQAGQTLALRDVSVAKYDLKALSPTGRATVDTRTPTLVWEAYPSAAYYQVYVAGGPSYKTVVDFVKVTATQYTVPTAMDPGEYHWEASAYNGSGTKIAECASLSYFVVK